MRRVWPLLLTLAGLGAAVAVAALLAGPRYWAVFAAVAVSVPVVGFLHLVVHEAGHLLAALLTRLRVTGVRISWSRHSVVLVVPAGQALPLRMALFTLAGPLANLAGAALAWHLWRQPLPPPVRVVAASAAVLGVLVAAVNLLPFRLGMSGPDPDGLNLLRWAFRPRVSTAAAVADPARLVAIIDRTSHPLVLLTAGLRLMAVAPGHPRVVPTAERLNAIAHDPRTKPAHAGIIASRLALAFGWSYLHMAIVRRTPVDRANADEIIEIAELGFRLRPRDEYARLALATVRLLDHRAGEARDLLAGFSAARPEAYALATGLFALAEIYLGNRTRADAVLTSASADRSAPDWPRFALDQIGFDLNAMLAALGAAEGLPPLVAPDQASEGSQSPTAYLGSSEANPPASAASAASATSLDPAPSTALAAADPAIAASSPDGSTPLRL